jgi:3-hydroxybutyrate dehydrogenase
MPAMLNGKAAIVTGSTSGIGLGIARSLAAAGANVVINGLGDAAEIEATRSTIEAEFGVLCHYDAADMTKPAQIAAMVEHTATTFGGVHILVNNAGIQHVAAIEDFPDDRWDAVIAINLSAVFHGMKHALPHMRAAGWGRVINIASAHGQVASPYKSAYVASKHAVVGLTKTAALETAGRGITCNAICPGWVLTPLVAAQIRARAEASGRSFDEEAEALLAEKQPSKTFTTPEQLGGIAVFLCSDAAANITGTNITSDGGWTAQ